MLNYAPQFYDQFISQNATDVCIVIVGNKSDSPMEERQVAKSTGQEVRMF